MVEVAMYVQGMVIFGLLMLFVLVRDVEQGKRKLSSKEIFVYALSVLFWPATMACFLVMICEKIVRIRSGR